MSVYEFTFPYLIDGKTAAEFDARCHFEASAGGEPEVQSISEFEVEAVEGSRPQDWKRDWAAADEHLAVRIEEWLWDTMATHEPRMLDIAAADRWGDACDRAYDEARDRRMEEEARP